MSNFRILTIASWVAIALIFGLSILALVWLTYPYKVAQIEVPIQILNENKEVKIGEPIIQELKITKPNNIAPTDPTRLIVCNDGNLHLMASLPITLNLPIGTYTFINERYILPEKVATGVGCEFIWRQAYQVNPIRKIHVEWKSETFTTKE